MKTHQKCRKNDLSLKNRGLVPTIKPIPDITYMKFQEILMTGCRGSNKKTLKMPPKWVFFPICDPQDFFFKNRALSLLYPYGALTSCKKLEKTNELSLRYLKTDGRIDHRGDY